MDDGEDPLRGDVLLRAMFAASAIAIALVDGQGRVVRCNPALQQFLGYTEDELIGHGFSEFTHPDDNDDSSERFGELMRGERTHYKLDKRYIRKDGVVVYGRLNVSLEATSGVPIAIGMIEDVGEAQAARVAEARTLHALGERVKELTALQALGRMLLDAAVPLAELLERVAALLPPAMQYPAVTAGRITYDAMTAATPRWDETAWVLGASFRTSDGAAGKIEVGYTAQVWPDSEPAFLVEEQALLDGMAALLRAALDRRLADEELRRTTERLDLALRTALAGVWEWEFATGRARWSKHAAELVGRDGEMVGEFGAFSHYIHPDDRDAMMGATRGLLEQQSDLSETEFRLRRADGDYRRMVGTFRLVRDAAGQPQRALGVALDVTARRALEERVRHGLRIEAMGQLAAGVAHDFGNLMLVLLSNAEMLLEPTPPAQVQAIAAEMVQASQHGAGLTRQLMAMCRKSVFAPVSIDLNQLLMDQDAVLRRLAGPHVRLGFQLDPSIPAVWADPTGLREVVMNLVVNARDAMPEGGPVKISTQSPDGSRAILAVTDAGPGIPEAVRARVFEPFFTTKSAGKGTGLGLAVVAGVVEQCGGQITVEPVVPHGTRFRIELPGRAPAP